MRDMEKLFKSLNGQWTLVEEPLEKSPKTNILHRILKELHPHVKHARVAHSKMKKDGTLSDSTEPHEEGLVNFDITSKPGSGQKVKEVLRRYAQHDPSPLSDMSDLLGSAGVPNVAGIHKDNTFTAAGTLQIHQAHRKDLRPITSPINMWTGKDDGKVNEAFTSSPNYLDSQAKLGTSATGEGVVRSKNYQGQDPRHADPDLGARITRAGNLVQENSAPYIGEEGVRALDSGASTQGKTRLATGQPVNSMDEKIATIENKIKMRDRRTKTPTGPAINSPSPTSKKQ